LMKRFVLGVVAIVTTVVGLYAVLLGPEELPPEPPEGNRTPIERVPENPSSTLSIGEGSLEIRRNDQDWLPLAAGEAISPGSDLRTGANVSASLLYREGVTIRVFPESRLGLREQGDVLRLVVSEGVAIADVQPESDTTVRFENESGELSAETRNGRLGVLVTGDGTLEAAVTRGQATVRSGDESLTLEEGYRTTVRPGAAPPTPSKIPRSLLLKVRWPEQSTSKRRQRVSGTTNPGARVRVGDTIVRADGQGRFQATIQLREGNNTIRVFALDATGRGETTSSPSIELDTRAPSATVETDPSMWE
ncbi:MAG: hypothetical protein AAFQ82_27175, partial [Myxococcota bacterium]